MAVSRDDLMHVAALARLAIPEERIPELVRQLNGILAHMDVLRDVDTGAASALRPAGVPALPVRPDAGPPIPLAAPRESFAPAMRDGFFTVPRLATHEDEDAE
ncbi:MAG TPA: Asp-tRNA(Asn)/Glu-tRNA(Gln) amidotransferase subunit GatC [Gemmatimonadaceae bacterium]|nr:Asp-tRNA(Asn)/Glu-tRNA(Gln) amidotransferase subunit GatC [Gemmatimonadaceae bacterium]